MSEIIVLVGLGFLFGGILKGATGAGAPLLAVPLLTLFYDVQTAVTLFAIPNLIPNVWQSWRFRRSRLPLRFLGAFAVAGSIGTFIGTISLASLPADVLAAVVALVVFIYIGFRLFNAHWVLAYPIGERLAGVIGGLAGTLQGASVISAPISITFLNALRLERAQFISTIAVFFCAVAVVQLPMLILLGMMSMELFWISCAGLIPLLAGMPIGHWLARYISAQAFDRIMLLVLAVLAVRLLISVI